MTTTDGTTVALRIAALIHNRRVPAQVRADLMALAEDYVGRTGAALRSLTVTINIAHEQMLELYEIYRAYLARCAQGDALLARHRNRRHR